MEAYAIPNDVMYLIGLVVMLETKIKSGEITDKVHIEAIERAADAVMEMRESEYPMHARQCYWLLTVIYPPTPEPKEPCRKILHS